jgi:hypothetical protein
MFCFSRYATACVRGSGAVLCDMTNMSFPSNTKAVRGHPMVSPLVEALMAERSFTNPTE